MPEVTVLYAGLLGLMAMVLAAIAGNTRGKQGIPAGDGGDKIMLLAMRRHANFIEFVPMILILIMLLEMSGVSATAIHVLGAALVIFRICHAVGISADSMSGTGRLVGAAGTALVLVVASIWNVVNYF